MPYIKNLASIITGADSCGGGMKKQGLVYGPDHARVQSGIISAKTSISYSFTLYGKAVKDCCISANRGTVGGAILRRGTQSTNAD